MRTRFAPTPSGYLHFGNFCNLIITAWFAKSKGCELYLRIDDYDQTRCRDAYLEDILKVIELTGIEFDQIPGSIAEFKKDFSQANKADYYLEELKKLNHTYACDCTRKMWSTHAIYPRTCLEKELAFEPGKNQLRYNVLDDDQEFYEHMGDFVLWRKENIPAYQWVSLIDDRDLGITHLVRGQDLFNSSMAQSYLANIENIDFVSEENILHHKLLEINGKKLSKSQSDPSILDTLKSPNGLDQLTFEFCFAFNLPKMKLDEILKSGFNLAIN